MAFSKLPKRIQFFSVNELTQFTEFRIWVKTYKTRQNKNKNKKQTIIVLKITKFSGSWFPRLFNTKNLKDSTWTTFFPFIKKFNINKIGKKKVEQTPLGSCEVNEPWRKEKVGEEAERAIREIWSWVTLSEFYVCMRETAKTNLQLIVLLKKKDWYKAKPSSQY